MKLTSPVFLYLYFFIRNSYGLLCYNGTLSNREIGEDPLTTKWLFGPRKRETSRLKCSLTVLCKGENAMCFVRSWIARARHSWIVQRGCYQTRAQDPFPRAMDTPTRAMSCRFERLPEADYKSPVSFYEKDGKKRVLVERARCSA
ncbi:hypothetical protein KGM_208570 [Danaus plexippus plexippus]|uniref:Secreted protein n=1 Tax=Danaus plexippus plexippus TaxID=278856 RepID=A0A212EJC5_DANPL|nr:hypothetical protein KGM_208570 [Danaus plexippus plexippus]